MVLLTFTCSRFCPLRMTLELHKKLPVTTYKSFLLLLLHWLSIALIPGKSPNFKFFENFRNQVDPYVFQKASLLFLFFQLNCLQE